MVTLPLTDIVVPTWGWHIADADLEHKLLTSLKQFGQIRPLVINTQHELIDGRFVLQAMQQLGWTEAACVVVDGGVDIALALALEHDIDYIQLSVHVAQLPDSIVATAPFSHVNLQHYRALMTTFDWSTFDGAHVPTLFDEDEPLDTAELSADLHVDPAPAVAAPARAGARPAASTARAASTRPRMPLPPLVPRTDAPTEEVKAEPLDVWDTPPTVPVAPRGGVEFFGADRPAPLWTPKDPPCLDGITDIAVNVETNGFRWYAGDRPLGITVGTMDGTMACFLPFAFAGGNLDEETIKRWAQRELRGKRITNANTRFEVHMLREWGIDLEEQGNTVSDVMHYAALLDEYRRQFALDVLAEDFLGGTTVPRVDEARMASYHAADVAARAEYQVQLVALLREEMWPRLDKEDLQRVRQLEDDVIYPVCEMEKNAAHIDRTLLKQWVKDCAKTLEDSLWSIAKDLGFSMNPDKNEDWRRLFAYYEIPITSFTANNTASFTDDVLQAIDHPVVQLARRAGKLASLQSKFLQAYDAVVGEDCRLRFALHQLRGDEYGTIRGRFSMSGGGKNEPRFGANLQQVFSIDNQRKAFGFDEDDSSHDAEIYLIRKLFIPLIGEYLSADAQSIEYRLAAHFANSTRLIAAYAADPWTDFHQVVMNDVSRFKQISRRTAKGLNFGKIYGAGKDTVAHTLGLERKDSDQIVDVYDKTFPEFKTLLNTAQKLAETRGYVRTLSGRRARFPDKQFSHKALNYVIQGSAADVMKTKLVELHKERKYTGFVMRQTVHDEVDGDATMPETAARVAEILNRQTIPLKVPIMWSVGTGPNWAEAK